MNKLFLKTRLLFLAVMFAGAMNAQEVSKDDAFQKAQTFLSKNANRQQSARKAPRKAPQLVLANNSSELYAFNDEANGGYVVISGDERMPDVLAYSYDGLYDSDNLPCNMKAWMEDYASQVAYLREHPEAKVAKRAETERRDIGPLLTCWFRQTSPYNDKCPEVDGKHCSAGCVAVAMAQIMYYHKWPKQTTDVIPGYTTYTRKFEMPAIPITTIDWENIGDENSNSNEKQADAISTLMLLCGVAADMDYGDSGLASGTDMRDAVKAFRYYFGYDDKLELVERHGSYPDICSDSDPDYWDQMIYDELNEGRPVLYSGPGHAFNIDGYENGYFHVNWGGDLTGEAYVTMTEVDGWCGMGRSHDAIIGIQPVKPDSPSRYAVFDNGKMTLYYDKEKDSRSGTVIPHMEEWSNYKEEVTECVIDPSFADIKMRNLDGFFEGWSKLKSIEGIKNLNTSQCNNMGRMFYGCAALTSLDLSRFKTDHVKHMAQMFYNCYNLTSLDVSGFNTDKVTSMGGMFYWCGSLKNLDISGFKTDNVENMADMFHYCSSLTNLDVSGFNTDKVTIMEGMFEGCSGLTSLDVSGFKTDNVTNMSSMFDNCKALTSLDLSGFNTDYVTNMRCMFYGCSSLTNLDVSRFNTDNVTNMGDMFDCCISLKSLDLSGFKTENVTDMGGMFAYCKALSTIYVGYDWNMSNVEKTENMFYGCTSIIGGAGTTFDDQHIDGKYARIDGGLDNPGYYTLIKRMPYIILNEDKTVLTFYYDDQKEARKGMTINSWQESGCSSTVTTVVFDASMAHCTHMTSMAKWFSGYSHLVSIIGIENLKTDYVTDMSEMFSGCSALTSLDLSGFKTDKVSNMSSMFKDSKNLSTIYVGEDWDMSNVKESVAMFQDCSNLIGEAGTTYDSQHTDSEYARVDGGAGNPGYFTSLYPPSFYVALNEDKTVLTFYYDGKKKARSGFAMTNSLWERIDGSSTVTTVIFDASMANYTSITNTSWWFYEFQKLTTIIDIENLKTDNVTNMKYMFCNCPSLTSLDLSRFKTDNVTNMSYMFGGCPSLSSLDLSSFNTSKVTNMERMFAGCSGLTSLDLSGFNTSNVMSMEGMFVGCSGLKALDLNSFNTDKVFYMESMFRNCSSLRSIDLSSFKTDYVKNMSYMFEDCEKLSVIYVGEGWNMSHVKETENMFRNCDNIIGGAGTTYNYHFKDGEYAQIDGGPDNPGYFTVVGTPLFYVELNEEQTSLTFYYDDKRGTRDGMIKLWQISSNPTVSTVVFDASMANYTSITSTANWFSGYESLTSIVGIENLNMDNVTSIKGMFKGCYSLTNLDLSGFKTDNVTDMSEMLYACYALTSLDLSGFKTDSVTDMSKMFSGCYGMTSLDLGGFKTDNVTDMSDMFSACYGLMSLDLSGFKTDNVTNMNNMFWDCSNLTCLDLSSFKTDNVECMGGMFWGCKELSTIYVSEMWTMTNVKESVMMFSYCENVVGGAGTTFDWEHTEGEYARIDGGPDNPGYFTYKDNTAIYPIKIDEESSDVYSLSGVRIQTGTKGVDGLKRGIYIVNDKKLIVK